MNDDRHFGVLSVQRASSEGHADERDITMMARLLPHFTQAVNLQLKMTALTDRQRADDFLLENSATAIVFLDSFGCVVSLNDAAHRMMNDPANGLQIQYGRVTARDNQQAHKIDRLINEAVQTGTGQGQQPGGGLPLPRENALPLSLVANPLPNKSDLAPLTGGPVAVLLISDPGQSREFPAALLRALFGLTPAECRLVRALFSGVSVTEYAERHRHQHSYRAHTFI